MSSPAPRTTGGTNNHSHVGTSNRRASGTGHKPSCANHVNHKPCQSEGNRHTQREQRRSSSHHRDRCGSFSGAAGRTPTVPVTVPATGRAATVQHSKQSNLLRVKQIYIGVYKMDRGTAGSKQETCDEISDEMKSMLVKICWTKDFIEKNIQDLQPAEAVRATKCSQNSATRRAGVKVFSHSHDRESRTVVRPGTRNAKRSNAVKPR